MSKQQAKAEQAAPAVAVARPIFVLAFVNPKKPGSKSHARFALYAENRTVEQYVAACVAQGQSRRAAVADLHWDADHGFISLTDPAKAA